jgi:hypothetical protein
LIAPLATWRCQLPDRPDWAWLRWHWQGQPILHEGVALQQIAAREVGQLACLSTPYGYGEGGPALAADYAAAWLQDLAQAQIMAISPAFIAGWSGQDAALPAPAVRACGCVIVPPAVGWRDAPDVWQAVCLALAAVKPVYLLEGCD